MPNGPSVYGIESTAKNVQGPDYRAIGEPIRIAPLDFSLFTQLGQLQVQRDNTAMQRERLGFEREALEYRKLNDQREYEYKVFQEISKNGPSPYTYNPSTQTVERGKGGGSAGVLDGTEFQRKVAEIDAELRKGMNADRVMMFQDLKNQGQGGSFDFSALLSNDEKYRQAIASNPVFGRYNVLNNTLTELQDQINKVKVEEVKGNVVADHRAISELYSMAEEIAQLDPNNMTDAEVMKYVQRAKSVNIAISTEEFDDFMTKLPEAVKGQFREIARLAEERVGNRLMIEKKMVGPTEDELVAMGVEAMMADPRISQYATQMFGRDGQDLRSNVEALVRARVRMASPSDEQREFAGVETTTDGTTTHKRDSKATVQYQMQSNDPNDAKAYTYTVFGDKDLNGMRLANSLVDEYSMTGMDAAMVVQEADSYIKQMQEQFEVPAAAEALGITKDMSRDQIVKIIAEEKFKQSNPKYNGTGASRPYYEAKMPTNADLGIDSFLAEEISTVVDTVIHDNLKAVMREESSGNPIAIWKDINGKISAGLFQFNGESLYNFLGRYINNTDIPNKELLSKYLVDKNGSYSLAKKYTEEELKNGQDVKDVQFVMAELLKTNPRAFIEAQQDYAYTQFVDQNLPLFNKSAGIENAHRAPGFGLMLNSISVNTGPWGNEQIYTNWQKNRKADPFTDPEQALYELHLERIKYVKPRIIRQAKERGMDANDFWQRMERRYLRDYYNAAALMKGWKEKGGSMYNLQPVQTPNQGGSGAADNSNKVYKIRLTSYDRKGPAFDTEPISDLGEIEQWTKGNDKIVLIGGFGNVSDAQSALAKAKERGFGDAYIAIEDGGLLTPYTEEAETQGSATTSGAAGSSPTRGRVKDILYNTKTNTGANTENFEAPPPGGSATNRGVAVGNSGAQSRGGAATSNEVATPTTQEDSGVSPTPGETAGEVNDLTEAVYSDEYISTTVPQLLKQLDSENTHMVTRPDGKEIRFRKNPNNKKEFFVYMDGENTQFLSDGQLFELLNDVSTAAGNTSGTTVSSVESQDKALATQDGSEAAESNDAISITPPASTAATPEWDAVVSYYKSGDIDRFVSEAEGIYSKGKMSVDQKRFLGQAYLLKSTELNNEIINYRRAVDILKDVIDEGYYPDNSGGRLQESIDYATLAHAQLKNGQEEEALATIRKAKEIDSTVSEDYQNNSSYVHKVLAETMEAVGDNVGAYSSYSDLISILERTGADVPLSLYEKEALLAYQIGELNSSLAKYEKIVREWKGPSVKRAKDQIKKIRRTLEGISRSKL